MAPWPNQYCPYDDCTQLIKDLLTEMVLSIDQTTVEYKAVSREQPGGAITCPYCQRAVEYQADGLTLTISARTPLRYSRAKMEARAKGFGSQKNPPEPDMMPEQWIGEDKLMPGALRDYKYAEDFVP